MPAVQGDIGSRYVRTYTTMSGCDVTAITDDKNVQTLAGISVSVTREKAPVYTLGSASPRSITRGKRGIAGSMVHTLFDRGPLWQLREDPSKWYYAHLSELTMQRNPVNAAAPASVIIDPNTRLEGFNPIPGSQGEIDAIRRTRESVFQRTTSTEESARIQAERLGLSTDEPNPLSPLSQGFNASGTAADALLTRPGASDPEWEALNNLGYTVVGGAQIPFNDPRLARGGVLNGAAISVKRMAIYSDQMMPFDTILTAQNEYGQASWSAIMGMEVINEGTGLSIDDITNETQMTYIALQREDWRPIEPAGSYGDPAQSAVIVRDGRLQVALADDRGNPLSATQEFIPSFLRDPVGNPYSVQSASTATGN